jgi:hypothetical protein
MIKSRRMRWARNVPRIGENKHACKVLGGEPEGKRLLGIPIRRREDNIKIDLKGI